MKEKEIEDKLEKNLRKIEPGLVLVERQKKVDGGIMDLFCKDKNGKYVIIEIKRKPDTNVVAQLAKYNMALIKNGISKKKLRTILVAPEFSKSVKNACEFFKFEIKNVYKEKNLNKTKRLNGGRSIFDNESLMNFVKRRDFVNLSMIARFFKVKNSTASDIVKDLSDQNLVVIKNIGGNKFVTLKS